MTAPRDRREERPENANVDGKQPPHDLDAEAAVLSAMMLKGTAAVDVVATILNAEDFWSEAHRRAAEACFELARTNEAIDILTVGGWLKDKGRLGQVGGTQYLAEILDAVPVVAHIETYARRVESKARLRRLAWQLSAAAAKCYATEARVDADVLLAEVERDVAKACARRERTGLVHVAKVLHETMDAFTHAEAAAREGRVPGIPTGFARLDRITAGLHPGDLTVIAARPGMGKTAFVTALLVGSAQEGYEGSLFSGEMPRVQIGARLACSHAWLNLQVARAGQMTADQWSSITRASSELAKLPIHIDDSSGITLTELRSKVLAHVADCRRRGKKPGAAILDYIQIADVEQERGESRDIAIGRFSRGLKELAKEAGIPVIALSQLNRSPESRAEKRPLISDLRESGTIENEADNIIFIYRDEYYTKEKCSEPGVAELDIAKQRNGPTGTIRLGFEKTSARFFNLKDLDQENDRTAVHAARGTAEPPPGFYDDFNDGGSQ